MTEPERAPSQTVDAILDTLERRVRVFTAAALHHPDLPAEWLWANVALAHSLAKAALQELYERDLSAD